MSRKFMFTWLIINSIVLILLICLTCLWESAIFPLMILLGLTLSFPLSISRALGFNAAKSYQKNRELKFYFDERGFGNKTDICDNYVKWKGYEEVQETEQYIFMSKKKGRCVYLFKNLIEDDILNKLKTVFIEAPIIKKKLP